MNTAFSFLPFTPDDTDHLQAATTMWNAACGVALAIQPATVAFNTRPATGAVQAGCLAFVDGAPCGFVSASALPADPATSPPENGWIDALVVAPVWQRQGVGQALLAWGEAWLAEQGCTVARLGGSLRPFAPGLPEELNRAAFFFRHGYQPRNDHSVVWDLARDLVDYPAGADRLPPALAASDMHFAPMAREQTDALFAFLHREFPGRWRFETEEWLRNGGDPGSYLLLWRARVEVVGFCRLRMARAALLGSEPESSGPAITEGPEPLDRFFFHGLPQPWGQLGTVGVAERYRGQGLGLALLDHSLRQLQAAGVRGCVIDWTGLLGLYGRFGFRPYRSYLVLQKVL